jgi:hypothetical protein
VLGSGTEWGRRKEEPRRNRHKTTGPPPEANRHRPVGRDMEMTAQARGWEQRILPTKGHSKKKVTDPYVYLINFRGTNQPQNIIFLHFFF